MKPITATEELIPLNLLIEWEDNPRKTRDENDDKRMAVNLLKVGQQAPLIVFKAAGETLFKVIEGETRRRGYNINVNNNKVAADVPVRCWVLPEDTTLDQLIAIAISANTVRKNMNPIEEMEAYQNLALAGMKIRAIAETFGTDQKTIRQRLALGSLIESARNLVRQGKRQMGWAQAMTLGSPAAQERIVIEIQANPTAYPDGASVRAELTRGNIPVASALFDPAELSDVLVCDLFSQQGDYFSDATKFWERQRQEIQKKIDELETTHKNVKFVDRQRFDDAGWTRGGVEADSTAVIIAHDDGSVEILTGMIPPAVIEDDDGEGAFLDTAAEHYIREHEVEATDNATTVAGRADAEADGSAAQVAKVEVNPLDNATKDTMSYLTAQVAASLKIVVANDPRLAMAFVVASTLTRRGPASTMQIAGLTIDTKDQTAEVFSQLAAKRASRDRIVTEAGIAGVTSPAEVIRKLLALDDGLLEQLFGWTVADSIAVAVDEPTMDIFDAIGAEVMAGWRIEESYLKTLSNAQARALASEVIDTASQPSPRSSRGQIERAIMEAVEADALAGNFLSGNSWTPPQIVTAIEKAAAKQNPAPADDGDASLAQAA